jgi:hypothetical protein
MKQFYKNDVAFYWGLLIVAVLLMFLESCNQVTVPANMPGPQTIHTFPVDELFLLHA